jgi:hypothetical protein
MSGTLTQAGITQALYDAYQATFDEPPSRFDYGARIYSHLHVDEGIGRVAALEWLDRAAKSMGLNERRFMTEAKPHEDTDYTIGEISQLFVDEAQRQGLLAA